VDERARFVARLMGGERMVDLCREYGISRKTGHKIWKRFQECGRAGLEDRRRAPERIPHKTTPELRALFVDAKSEHPTWGPRKIKAWLEAKQDGLVLPSANTIGHWLKREGLVSRRPTRRYTPTVTKGELTTASAPNEVWCVDFKGQFLLGDGRYCYPLTITDLYSRFLIACTALESTKWEPARWAFEEAFREYGVPAVIRSDNGCPFATTGLLGLSSLSVFWMRLGIRPERIEKGCPQQNGEHERMHLTLKQETTRPAGANALQQQERFDEFRREFNEERPHEALGQKPPTSLYAVSTRAWPEELPDPKYPLHDLVRTVSHNGCVYLHHTHYAVAKALVGQKVGLRELEDGRWLVTFMTLDLGSLNLQTKQFEPRES
jgi:transposase InsO family protein